MGEKELKKMRNMSDDELRLFLDQHYIKKGNKRCIKCSRKVKYYVKLENCETFQTKKVCALCQEHYDVLLRHLKLNNIEWGE